MTVTDYLNQFKTHLAESMPNRTVTRNWRDRSELDNVDLKEGQLTLVYRGCNSLDDPYNVSINLLVIGRIYAGHDAKGQSVEDLELTFFDEFKTAADQFLPFHLVVNRQFGSSQVEVPQGWFIAECMCLGLDLAETPEDDIENPNTFIGFEPNTGEDHLDEYYQVGGDLEQ